MEWINTLNISQGFVRIINILISMFFMVHLMACFWHLAAMVNENTFDTWVEGKGLIAEGPGYKYLNAFYWSF